MKLRTGIIFIIVSLIISISAWGKQANVFIISVNGFRADFLERGLTLNINSLANNGIKANLKSVFPTMLYPTHISLFTGCYPENHGIISDVFKNANTGEYYDSRLPESYNNPKWYDARFLWEYAEKFGIYSSMIMIPGASLNSNYRASYYFIDREEHTLPNFRISDALNFLHEPLPYTPRITALCFDELDDICHHYGIATDSTNEAIKRIDSYVGIIIDSLKSLNIFENTDLIFLSTFGMIDVKDGNTVNIGNILYGSDVDLINFGSFAYIYNSNNKTDSIKALINKNEHIYAFAKNEIPDSLKIKNSPFAPEILIMPEKNYVLIEKNDFPTYNLRAIHGYPPDLKEMQGVFVATGPSFKKNYQLKEIRIIDIFPLICRILGINIPTNIDGNLQTIKEILE